MLNITGAQVARRYLYISNRIKLGAGSALIGLLILLQTVSSQAVELPFTEQKVAENTLTLTLPEALKRALAENPSLKVFEFREQILSGELATATLRPAYELEFEAENFAGSGNSSKFDQAEFTIALSSTIELGDKRNARRDVLNRGLNRLEAQNQVESLALLGDVTRRYIDVLAAQERVTLAQKANQLAQDASVEVKNRAEVGAAPDAEARRAQAAAAQAHLTAVSEANQLEYLKVALASLWGAIDPGFGSVSGDLYRFGEDIEFDALYDRVKQNPAIQIFGAEERLKNAELRLAKTQASTDVRWSVGLRQLQEVDDTALVAGFSMPLFSGRRSSGVIRSAAAARDEVFVRKEVALLGLHTQLFRAFNNRQQAIHTANDLRRDIVPALEQALEETKEAYQRGRYSYIDYVTARQELLSANRTLIDAASAALRYGAEIEQLTAQPLLTNPGLNKAGGSQIIQD